MLLETDVKLNFNDVVIRPKRSVLESRSEVCLERSFLLKNGNISSKFSGIPIIAANMATGTFKMLEVFAKYKMFVAIAKYNSSEWLNPKQQYNLSLEDKINYGIYTIGMSNEELLNFDKYYQYVYNTVPHFVHRIKLCVDIANGYTQKFGSFISKIREGYPSNLIIAGNVATPDMTQELILAGADIIKVGVSQGGACFTRLKTGIGVPQLSAVIECSDAAHSFNNAYIISDGGCRCVGDISRAFCGNADMVMVGSLLAGTYESDGDIITRYFKTGECKLKYEDCDGSKVFEDIVEEKQYKLFYGMSSDYAQQKHSGEIKNYRTSEGRVEEVEYKGLVDNIIKDILGGLRSTGTYIGAKNIKHFGKCATFLRTNQVHDRF
jgi:GMP reductase